MTQRRRLAAETLEVRRVLAASFGWDGPGLGSAELTYYIANSPDSLSQSETDAAIETALAAWSSAADITFTETDQPGLRDSIDISFTNIDGVGGTLAQAYFPDDVNPARIAGDVQIDISDAWEVGNSLGRQAFDLIYVAVHEIGHSLGLEHTSELESVLTPFVSANEFFTTLERVDAMEIQELYAAAASSNTVESPVDETPIEESPVDETSVTETPTDEAADDDTDSVDGQSDSEDDPFPRRRWRRWGHWRRWGGRLEAETPDYNYANPTDVNNDGSTSALDALMVINQLNRDGVSEDVDLAGLCDTNGDGQITALDALTVINSIGTADNDSVEEDASEADSEAPTDEVEETDIDVVDVQADEVIDPTGEVEDTDEEQIDDGGMVDDSEDEADGNDDTDHGRSHVGLFGKDAESLITRFDTSGDGALTEDEVSERLWSKLTDLEVDADADGLVTLTELETAFTAARQEVFNGRDNDGDGLLNEVEVSKRLWSKIESADTDDDSGVSFAELEAFRADRIAGGDNSGESESGQRRHRRHLRHRATDRFFANIGRSGFRR